MRVPQPTLFEGAFCAPCQLPCAEKDTDAACDEAGAARLSVHPGVPDVFEQFCAWAPRPSSPRAAIVPPALPAYMPILPREAVPGAVRCVSGPLVFTLRDFFALAGRAERRGIDFRRLVGAGGRRIVVLGADPDPFVIRAWRDWPRVRERLLRHRPDLVVGPDLGFYENDQPAPRILFFNAHTVMYAQIAERGVAALPPIGWTLASDIERFAAWAREFEVPGAFLDLQRRTAASSFDEVVDDLRRHRDRFTPTFLWIVNGVQTRSRWEQLQRVLGTVRFTSSGAWHEARNGRVLDPDLGSRPTQAEPIVAFSESVSALTLAADGVLRASHEPTRVLRVRQLPSFEAAYDEELAP